MKRDKYIKDVARRLDYVVPIGNGRNHGDTYNDDQIHQRLVVNTKYDDEYCLDVGSELLRFAYYRPLRSEQCFGPTSFVP